MESLDREELLSLLEVYESAISEGKCLVAQ